MEMRLIEMIEEMATHTNGVVIRPGAIGWMVHTLETDNESAREWGAGPTLNTAIAECHKAFME